MTAWKDMTDEQKAGKRRSAKKWRTTTPGGQAYLDRERSNARGPRARKYHLKSRYKMTHDDYDALLERQGGVCAICKSADPGRKGSVSFPVDHDHSCCPGIMSCGKCIRGLLCHSCNGKLGWMEKNLEAVLAYVDRAYS